MHLLNSEVLLLNDQECTPSTIECSFDVFVATWKDLHTTLVLLKLNSLLERVLDVKELDHISLTNWRLFIEIIRSLLFKRHQVQYQLVVFQDKRNALYCTTLLILQDPEMK